MLLIINADAAATITATGWTRVTGAPQSISGALKGDCFYRIASSEPASYTPTSTGGNMYEGVIVYWTNPTPFTFDNSNGASATAISINAPSVTFTGSDELVVRVCVTWNATSVTFASGTSRVTSGSNGDLIRVYDQDLTSSPTGTDQATANASNQMVAYTVAFVAATGGGGGGGTVVPVPRRLLMGVG